jgi:2,4-dienoyl-CoA reductase-like NADH-dependent reductase (Old Yellow Enzyme family)
MAVGTQFSVKIPGEMEEQIEAYADETHRTKSNAVIHLAHVGVSADEAHVEEREEGPGVDTPISISTEFTSVVEGVHDLADDEFDGTFSRAIRWAIRNGLAEEEADD